MKFQHATTESFAQRETDLLVLPVSRDSTNIAGAPAEINTLLAELAQDNDFTGKAQQTVLLHRAAGVSAKRLLLVGTGSAAISNKLGFELARTIATAVLKTPATSCSIVLPSNLAEDTSTAKFASDITSELHQISYKYRRTLSKPADPSTLVDVTLLSDDSSAATGLAEGDAVGLGMSLTRELGNLPANICTPTYLEETAKSLAEHDNIVSNALDEAQMEELGMGSLLSVAAGTVEPAKLVCIEYTGAGDAAPVVLVGKGVTFDTGGISLKPGGKMDEMKYDMCGAATVLGVFKALSVLNPEINVVGVIPATENMPAGNATKPGDVVTSMAGKTIEILNTDAEGRLILCDALTYAARYEPKAVIDIATLTGACIVALGHHRTAIYSNNDDLRDALFNAGESTRDLAWPMPLDEAYTKQLKSNFADLANIGGPAGGSVTAACFLAEFTQDYNWAHMDIAGSAWNSPGLKGASGRPVSLLFNYLLNQ